MKASMVDFAFLGLVILAAVYWLAAFASVVLYRRRRPSASDAASPVTILKPLRGNDGQLYENLRSFCLQDYRSFEILFGVRHLQDPAVAVVRSFNMQTGLPVKSVKVAQSTGFNDLEASSDGTVYATVTGTGQDATTWQVWKITPDGTASIFVQGAPMRQPNGIAFDQQGNIVVVNIGTEDVITYSKDGKAIKTEKAAQSGNDGLVVMKDGTKYVSSVVNGGVSRIRPGRPAELIAKNIPNPASMCYDPDANQLVIPMNANNALSFIKLR